MKLYDRTSDEGSEEERGQNDTKRCIMFSQLRVPTLRLVLEKNDLSQYHARALSLPVTNRKVPRADDIIYCHRIS